ncbi:DUF2218 domain-containing protein [Streptomyces cadmiisoli]|uniref:DUF2218 domain-containing protein n=1 Tax=Streptomyces cadmiisoli TaxID=2184053 RepID=UPI00366296B8
MLIAEARIQTEHSGRYLSELCRQPSRTGGHMRLRPRPHHADMSTLQHIERSVTRGTVDLGWARCTLHAGTDVLTLRAEAADQDSLLRIQRLMTRRLQKAGRRDAPQVTWQQSETVDHRPVDLIAVAPDPPRTAPARRPRRRATIGLIAVVALAVAVHLGVGGLLLVSGPWGHWALGALLAVALAKAVFLLGRRAARRRGRW